MIQRYLLGQSRAIAPRLQALSRPPLTQSLLRQIPKSSLPWRKAPRSYSSTAAPPESKDSNPEQTQPESKEEDPVNRELEAKDKEIIDLKDKYLRSVASFRNLQDITKRDIQTARDYAISSFATDLIESIDNLDRALATVPKENFSSSNLTEENGETSSGSNDKKVFVNLYEGLKMTESILMQTLKKHGLDRFDPSEPGTKFDPRLHEATFQTKIEGKEDGDVVMVQQKGFMLNGRVLRAAKVGVAKNA